MNTLEGIRVVDLSQNIAGPYGTQMLADLGADVVKVEPPGGDPARTWGPPFWEGETPLFLSANRNKRSICVDLKSDGGKKVVDRLVDSADVFVQAFRAGVIDSLGFGYETLKQRRPEMIYASVTGFGSRGPLRETPGYDPLIQAYSGFMSITGFPDGPPARAGASVVDLGTGILVALGVLAALRDRDRTGKGTHVEAALLDTSLGWISYHLFGYLASGQVPGRQGTGIGMIAPYEAFATKDGELMIAGGNEAIFSRLCEALGLGEVAADPRFVDNPTRVAHRDELHEIIEARTTEMTTAELRAILEQHRVPCSPIQDIGQVVNDPQVQASGMLDPCPHPRIPDYRNLGFPLRFDGDRPALKSVPPLAGEHTREVLEELQYSREEIDSLARDGSVVMDGAASQGE